MKTFFFLLLITLGSLPPLVKPELLQPEPCKSPVNQSNHSENAKESFDHKYTAQPGPDDCRLELPFQRNWLATKFRDSVIAHTYKRRAQGLRGGCAAVAAAATAAATAAAVGLRSLG